MAVIRRTHNHNSISSSNDIHHHQQQQRQLLVGSWRQCCRVVWRGTFQFLSVLTWGVSLGVLVAVYRHAGRSVQDIPVSSSRLDPSIHDNNHNRRIDPQHHLPLVPVADPLPVGADGLPSLTALLEKHQALRGPVDHNNNNNKNDAGTTTAGTSKEEQAYNDNNMIDQQNALLNPNNACPLPPKCKIIQIPTDGLHDIKLAVWADEDFISDTLATKKAWEIQSINDMAALAPSQTLPTPSADAASEDAVVFYDVGAHVGYYSFLFAARGYVSVAVEPEPGNLALLRASQCLNPALNVHIVPVALSHAGESSSNSTCRLYGRAIPRTLKYLHATARLQCSNSTTTIRCSPIRAPNEICVDHVPTRTLAQLLWNENIYADNNDKSVPLYNHLPTPAAIIKIDVEGHELQVLQGLLLSSNHNSTSPLVLPKVIQFENRDPRIVPQLTQLLTTAGYTLGTARGHDDNTLAERLQEE